MSDIHAEAAAGLIDDAEQYLALARATLEEALNTHSPSAQSMGSARHHITAALAELRKARNMRGAA